MLQGFAADIERQIFRIHHTTDKPQMARDDIDILIGDEHAFYIKFQARHAIGVEEIEGFGGRDEQQVGIFDCAFGFIVQDQPWLIRLMRDVAVKFLVLFGCDFGFRAHPESGSFVGDDCFAAGFSDCNRKADMVGIGADDVL